MSDDVIDKIFSNIEKRRSNYPTILREVIKILPVEEPGSKLPMTKVLKWAESNMRHLGGFVTVSDLGYADINGAKKRLSPVLHGVFRASISKPTVCVYSHLEAFNEEAKCSKSLFGRGVADAKGPLLCWFYAIQSYKSVGAELPVNVKFLIENMKDHEVPEFFKYLKSNKTLLFEDIKYICVSDSPVLEGTKPLITYGYRGCCRFNFTLDGGEGWLESGKYSGAVQEVMTDTVALLSSIVSPKGVVLIDGLSKDIDPVTPEEEKACRDSSFSIAKYKNSTGAGVLLHDEKKNALLMYQTRYPTISIHCVETEDSTISDNLIPTKATASFTVTTVPHQRRQDVYKAVTNHLLKTFKELKSTNKLYIDMPTAIKYWLGDCKDNNYKAASKAVHKVIKEEPEPVRRGTHFSAVADLKDVVENISIVLLPVGYSDTSGALCMKSDIRTFMDGVKIVVSYLNELSKL